MAATQVLLTRTRIHDGGGAARRGNNDDDKANNACLRTGDVDGADVGIGGCRDASISAVVGEGRSLPHSLASVTDEKGEIFC